MGADITRIKAAIDVDGPLPSYDELPRIPEVDASHCWGLFGAEDERGTFNLLTPARVRAACSLVQTGQRIGLSLPLDQPQPSAFNRNIYKHELLQIRRDRRDDYLDGFYPQASSQWDALRHIGAREFGWYNGFKEEAIDVADGGRLGIEQVAAQGIIGRGVLVDAERAFAREGKPLDPFSGTFITAQDLERTLALQSIKLRPGDILLVRTGWLGRFLALSEDGRRAQMASKDWAGLDAAEDMARFLWNQHVTAVCADNLSVEFGPGDSAKGFLHRRMIPLLGTMLGEIWALDELARECERQRRYEFLLMSVPLRLPGGVGSPANAVAVF